MYQYNNIYASLHKYLKEKKKKTQTDYWGKKKALDTVEINVKMLWTKNFFLFDL